MPKGDERNTPPLSDEEHRLILESMPEGALRQGVIEGKYYILGDSDTPGKPMIRWADGPMKGKPVKGSGGRPGQGAIMARVSKENAYKRTKAYREIVEEYWGPRIGELFSFAEEMMKGGMVTKTEKVTCPCGCGFEFQHTMEMYKKGDAQALKVVWEGLIGRASERKEVDINIRSLVARIDARQNLGTLEIVDLSPEQVTERIALAAGRDAEVYDGAE